jgi:hypothetical protein
MTAPPAMTVRVMGYERLYLRDFQPQFGIYKYMDVDKATAFPGLELFFDNDDECWIAWVDGKWEATASEAQVAVETVINAAAFDCLVARKEHQQ